MTYYNDCPELYTDFFRLQKAVLKFYTDDYFNEKEIGDRAFELCSIIDLAFDKNNMRGYYHTNSQDRDYFKVIVQNQLTRINNKISINDYKSTQAKAPFVRIGPVDHELEQPEYDWFQEVCEQQGLNMQEWISYKVSPTAVYKPIIENKHWVSFDWGFNGRGNKDPHQISGEAPDFSSLSHLKTLFISSKTPELTIYSDSITKMFASGDELQKFTLQGDCSLQELKMAFCENLTYCDISLINVLDLWEVDIQGTKNLSFKCTEAQYKYCNALKKCRAKKTQISSTSREIDIYAFRYNWDLGYAFLNWVIKHPKCELTTALTIYWSGSPLYFAGKTADEIESYNQDNYKLIKEIEKRVLKKKYISSNIPFDATSNLNNDELEKAKKVIAPELFQGTYNS